MASRRKSSLSSTSVLDGDVSDPYSTSFDPSSLKVVQLRALLSEHEVVVPSNARKADLIRAYESEIRPNVEELRAARNRDRNIRPSAEGMTVLSADGYPVFKEESSGNESESNLPPSALFRSGTPRRGRRSVSWAEDVSGPEDDEEEEAVGNASTFSIDNPFQSPRLGTKPKKELIVSSREAPAADSSWDADISRDAYDDPPSSPTVQKKKRKSRLSKKMSDDEVDAKEEDPVQKARGVVWFFISATLLSWWIWYASESRVVGFCDVGRRSNTLLDDRAREVEMNRQAIEAGDENGNVTLRMPMALRPTCLPCPPHARCQSGVLIGCESSDYVLRLPLFAHLPVVGTIAPLSWTSPSCFPDQQKVLLAADLADEIESRLRIWKGHVQCKREVARFGSSTKGEVESKFALPRDELYQDLKAEVEKSNVLSEHPEDYYEELWTLAMEDLEASGRVEEFQSTLFAKRGGTGIGLGCRMRMIVGSAWQKMRFWLATLFVLALSLQWVRHRFQSNKSRKGQTKELVVATLARLEEVKRISIQSSDDSQDGFLSITQLRDDILRNESLESKKKNIWMGVIKAVESNTNVRTRQAKVRGEWSRVWEWIGALEPKKGQGSRSNVEAKEVDVVVNRGNGRLPSAEV